MNLKSRYIILFPFFYLFLIISNDAAFAIDFDARDTRIDLPVLSTPNNAVTPSIAADDSGHIYIAWSDNRGGSYSIYTNTFFPGKGWNVTATPITTGYPRPRDAQEGEATAPQICADNSGHIYVAWIDDRGVKAGTGKRDIYFRYSKDYGTNWYPQYTDERIDTDNPTIGTSKNLKIACDNKGNVYLVWEDDRNRPGFYEIYFRSLQIQFDKPTDFISFYQTPEVRLNTGLEAGKYPAHYPVIATDNNNVYVAWYDTRDKPEDNIYQGIYFNVSHNNGISWKSSAIRLDNSPIAGFLTYTPPVISSDTSGHVYVAWTDNAGRPLLGDEWAPDGTTDVYFNKSRDYGDTWDEDQRINMPNYGDHQATEKDVAIGNNNDGIILIAWVDDRYGEKFYNIFTNHSEDYGNTFLDTDANIRIDTSVAEPGIALAAYPLTKVDPNGVVFVSWIDNRTGTSDIFFNFSTDKGKKYTWQKTDYWIDYPIPPGNSILPQMSIDNAGHFYIVWMDTRSALAKDNYNIYFMGGFFDIQTLQIEGQQLGQACFIATAAYGSHYEHIVKILQRFRDSYLLTNNAGKKLVKLYYRFSPPAATFIIRHEYFKPVVRLALMPAVGVAAFFVYTSLLQKVIVIMLIMHGMVYLVWKSIRRKKQEVRS